LLSISDTDPTRRLSVSEALDHPYLTRGPSAPLASREERDFVSATIRRLEEQLDVTPALQLLPGPPHDSYYEIVAIPPDESGGHLRTGQWFQDSEVRYLKDPRSAKSQQVPPFVQPISSGHIPAGWDDNQAVSVLFMGTVEIQPAADGASWTAASNNSADLEEVEIPAISQI
jgi:hypothetical protein